MISICSNLVLGFLSLSSNMNFLWSLGPNLACKAGTTTLALKQ